MARTDDVAGRASHVEAGVPVVPHARAARTQCRCDRVDPFGGRPSAIDAATLFGREDYLGLLGK
ncbi:putative uncharacterized protein [Rhodococcus sp. AW25M09]|uniref:hypothetical protein n=1 Tax=Rhodococcus sp. AW25M09 TaxID=1268303 RepID=UPI0002ABE632|nr:hypothetical protein [Rhodococcus sp. AW25M09]CCQ14375.1 putative uncharacterized protein [Rhodococcus sp. AW25M09]